MSDAPPVPAVCPKCGHARVPAGDACGRCGLIYANWKPELADTVAPLDDVGASLWAAAQLAWDDAVSHDAFVKHCSQAGLLPAAGRAYRERLARDANDPVARRMQERIVQMAMAALGSVARPPMREPVTRSKGFWLVVAAALVAAILAALLRGRG